MILYDTQSRRQLHIHNTLFVAICGWPKNGPKLRRTQSVQEMCELCRLVSLCAAYIDFWCEGLTVIFDSQGPPEIHTLTHHLFFFGKSSRATTFTCHGNVSNLVSSTLKHIHQAPK